MKFNKLNINEIKLLLEDNEESKTVEIILTNRDPSESLLQITSSEQGETSAIYYVAGYIAFSLKKKLKCPSCKASLVVKDTPPEPVISGEPVLDSEEQQQLKTFIEIMSRGGLSTPSDQLYITCLYANSLFEFISSSPKEKDSLMSAPNCRASFCCHLL